MKCADHIVSHYSGLTIPVELFFLITEYERILNDLQTEISVSLKQKILFNITLLCIIIKTLRVYNVAFQIRWHF